MRSVRNNIDLSDIGASIRTSFPVGLILALGLFLAVTPGSKESSLYGSRRESPSLRQPRSNFAAWAILVASLLAACTVWLSTGARIAEQSPIRFGLPIDTLKVRGSFVRPVLSNPQDAAFVTGLMTLGQTLGLKVVCEGIETVEQLRFIERTRQCDEVRGFVVSQPVEAGRFQQLLIAEQEMPVLRRIGSKDPRSETQGIALMEDWSELGGIA